jgi:hypothetical protein
MGSIDRAVPFHHLSPFLPRVSAGQARTYVSESVKEVRTMNYISDCCGAPAVEGTLNTWNDYERDFIVVTYGTCSECKEPSQFSEGE